MNPGMMEFKKLLDMVASEMKSEGVTYPMAMKIAKIYNDNAKSEGLSGIDAAKKAIETFKKDSKANRMKAFNEVKNMPKKERKKKSKKSKKGESDSE